MLNPDLNAPPINPLPPVVVLLFLLIMGPELYFQAAQAGFVGGTEGIGARIVMARQFGVFDNVTNWMIANRSFPPEHVMRFFTYSFVHQTFLHALMVSVFVLALGKFIAEHMHHAGVLVVFFASAFVGALAYTIVFEDRGALLGGYPGAYGIIGAFTWVIFSRLRSDGKSGLPAFRLIAVFMALQTAWKMFFGGTNEWFAELMGFFTGFGLSVVLANGARQRIETVMARLRQRD